MRTCFFRSCGLALIGLFFSSQLLGQGMGMSDNPAYKAYFDSLRTMEYNYPLPIWGDKAYQRGYDIQYPLGLSAVFFTQSQDILIERTLIGFNGSEMADLSDFIVFGPTRATTYAYTVRPDIWLFPFMNVYGIFGGGTTQTEITLLEPVGFQTEQRFRAISAGIGITLVGALGPIWLAWDNNYNYADVEVVVEPVPAFNSSLRVGHNFMSPYRPDRSLAIWAGMFYQSIQNDTEGKVPLQDIFPNAGEGQLIDRLDEWAETLPPPQRLIVRQIINKLEEIAEGLNPEDAIIDYKLDKKVAGPFNLILGAQFQFNKHWILRTEMGVFGKRSQFLLNLNYRFQGFRKR